MLVEALGAVQDAAPVAALRRSIWVYPLVNAGHIVGLALLFGAIVPLDLRLAGLWRGIPLRTMAGTLLPVAVTGLTLAVLTGSLLFSVRAVEYAGITMFRIKLLLILGAVANALLLHRSLAWAAAHQGADTLAPPPRLRIAGGLSIALWLAVIVAGRMIGYLE